MQSVALPTVDNSGMVIPSGQTPRELRRKFFPQPKRPARQPFVPDATKPRVTMALPKSAFPVIRYSRPIGPGLVDAPADIAKHILADMAAKYEVDPKDIRLGRSRKHKIIAARHEAMYHIAVRTEWSFPQIGRFMKRDHTSILFGIWRHCERHGLDMPRGSTFRGKSRA